MAKIYEHEYIPLSMYGNVISLLRDQMPLDGVHVDIGCGYGAIAEPIRDEFGLEYLGFDQAEDGLESLRERGFRVDKIDLSDLPRAESTISKHVGDRQIASITILDTLEHITNGADVLAMLHRLASRHGAILVLSVPNITHKDIALSLLIGRWDITESGLLDHTHFSIFSHGGLHRLLHAVGWKEIGKRDWLLEHSDQEFPTSAPTLKVSLPVGHFLRNLIDQANPWSIVNQFVRSYRPEKAEVDVAKALTLFAEREEVEPFFLTVIVATEQQELSRLRSILSDLEIQTIQDFEVVLVVFGGGSIDDTSISDPVADLAAGFRERITIHRSERAERIDALNDVLGEVRGGYVAFLRAEDQVEPGWCASFVDVRSQFPYRVLRCRGAGQFSASGDVQHAPISQSEDIIPLGLDEPSSIAEFALPAGLFRNLGLRFDPRIEDGADWDLVTQSVLFCDMGVSSTPGVAARRTQASAISTSDVPHPKRVSGFSRLAKLNAYPLLLAPGSAVRIRALQAERDELRARLLQLREAIGYPRLRAFLGAYFPEIGDETWRETEQSAAPFLSVITRTRGTRIGPLREALLCLAGQSSQDFELLLVIHNATESDSEKVHALVVEFPSSFRERITVLICNRPGRASPLNDAVARTKGRYVAVLDDDDFVLGHWVETFLELSSRAPGTLLRARCARQDFELSEEDKSCSQARASSWPTLIWPSDFDQIDHLSDNYSPFMSVAFPAEVFRKCQLRFDEALSTTEDWDFIVRTSLLCGVSTSPNVTAIYRWWTNGESSAFLHKREEWVSNRERIIQKIDSHPILLPAGSVARINGLASSLKHMTARSEEYFRELLLKDEQMRQMYALKEEMSREVAELHVILKSRSWRITKPLRAMSELLARGRSSFRARLGNLARALYRGLPLPTSLRLRLKSVIFRTAPFLFRSTAAYQAWSKLNPRDRG